MTSLNTTPAKTRGRNVTAAPHLAEFPTPQPLSEQEQLLVRFVTQHRTEAILLAEAQAANAAEWQRYREALMSATPE